MLSFDADLPQSGRRQNRVSIVSLEKHHKGISLTPWGQWAGWVKLYPLIARIAQNALVNTPRDRQTDYHRSTV